MSKHKQTLRLSRLTAISLVALVLIASCKNSTDSEHEATVSGTVVFDDMVELKNITRVKISIVDTTIIDTDSILISEAIISPVVEVPIEFSVNYDAAAIDPSNIYSVSVEVFESNKKGAETRAYITTRSYPVITRGNSDEINVVVNEINR